MGEDTYDDYVYDILVKLKVTDDFISYTEKSKRQYLVMKKVYK